MTIYLGEQLPVDRLAARTHMSPDTFARRFCNETVTTPLQWLINQRTALTEELLENSTLTIEQIAVRVGFGQGSTLRHHFAATRGTTPQQYRRAFSCVDATYASTAARSVLTLGVSILHFDETWVTLFASGGAFGVTSLRQCA